MSLHHVEIGVCPFCGKGQLLALYRTTYVPNYGHVVIMTLICNLCHFRESDVLFLSEKGSNPTQQEIRITKDALGNLLVVTSGATISIPQLGYDITFYTGEIKTVEGLLLEAKEQAEKFLTQTSGEKRNILSKVIKTLEEELKNPSGKLTLILKDTKGYSKILPKEAWEKRVLEERKLQELGKALPPSEIREHIRRKIKNEIIKKLSSNTVFSVNKLDK